MEILRILLSFLLKEFGGEQLQPLINAFKENGFNLKSALSCLTPEMIAPIFQMLFNGKTTKPCAENNSAQGYGLSAIADIADKNIVFTLNKYFYSC
ncbi:MAG: hypothetical protein IKB67_05760 [Clostridia bacterium]|nr:hypothetical protein [Clostridia bacterium]